MLTKQTSVNILLPETVISYCKMIINTLLSYIYDFFVPLNLGKFNLPFKLRVFDFLFKTHIYFQCALKKKKNQVSIPTVMKIKSESW